MNRRQLMTLMGGAAMAWPPAVRAQQERIRRLGILNTQPENDPDWEARRAAVRQGLEKLGWTEGRNIRIDFFTAGSADRYPPVAKELVASRPDVILVSSGPITAAVQKETRSIPIVFTQVSDPVGGRLVESLAHPGGNVTGFLLFEDSITGKWLAMLKEIAPELTRVALVGNPKTVPFDYYLHAAEAIAPSLSLEVVPTSIGDPADIERSIEAFAQMPNGGLMLMADATLNLHRPLIVALAARYRLPAVYGLRAFVAEGGLMSYDTDRVDQFRGAASYIDRILRGAKPADLPVQAPTRFQTVVNLKTAKALGLEVPGTLLVRADEVIE
jgi:putative ABC transport system substrate-binding protein